ncbi:7063_t:CDS:2, partial [Racocetra persica]
MSQIISQIYYKFKSAKDYDTLTFDGLGISVFDAKKEILTAKKLKGNDFDIIVSHAESGEDYQEDTATIPRNTPIVVKRVPTKPGKGTAHRYLEGGGPTTQRNYVANNRGSIVSANGSMSKTFDPSKQPQQVSRLTPTPATQQTDEHQTEDDKIQAMFAQSKEFWEITQEQMASPNQVRPSVKPPVQKTLPPNYVCYRCGQKGHWIQACPTNGDRSFDHMKVRKTTGIPRSFLQKVEQVPPGKGVLVTQDGNLVIAQANEAAWQKFHARQKSYVTSNEVLEDTLPIPAELQCMLCSRLLKEAVITPCCRASFCDE